MFMKTATTVCSDSLKHQETLHIIILNAYIHTYMHTYIHSRYTSIGSVPGAFGNRVNN